MYVLLDDDFERMVWLCIINLELGIKMLFSLLCLFVMSVLTSSSVLDVIQVVMPVIA